jgi:hypothetical protein
MLFLLLSTFKHKKWLRMLFFATQKTIFALEVRKSRFFDPRTRCHSNSEFSASFPTDSQQNLRMHVYEVRPRKDHRDVNLISDALPFGRLWYGEPSAVSNAVDYTKFRSRSHNAVIRVYDEAGNVIRVHEEA